MPSPAQLQHSLTETNKHGLTADIDGALEMNFCHTDKGMAVPPPVICNGAALTCK